MPHPLQIGFLLTRRREGAKKILNCNPQMAQMVFLKAYPKAGHDSIPNTPKLCHPGLRAGIHARVQKSKTVEAIRTLAWISAFAEMTHLFSVLVALNVPPSVCIPFKSHLR